MQDAEEYQRYADECRRLAQQLPAQGEALLKIAKAWDDLATEARKRSAKAKPE